MMQARNKSSLPAEAYLALALVAITIAGCAGSNQIAAPLPELDRKTKPAATPVEQKAAIDSVLTKGATHKSEALKKIEAAK